MKNNAIKLILFLSVLLVGCQKKETAEVKSQDQAKSNLIYDFSVDKNEYQFDLPEGWVKFPEKDDTIVFLVGNKELKAFMSAGFEEKAQYNSLVEYEEAFLAKLAKANGKLVGKPEHKDIGDTKRSFFSVEMMDKNKVLSYRISLIETSDYFINLGAWTSEANPPEATFTEMDRMLNSFTQIN